MSPLELMARAKVPTAPGTSMEAKSRAEAGCDAWNARQLMIGRRERSRGNCIALTLFLEVSDVDKDRMKDRLVTVLQDEFQRSVAAKTFVYLNDWEGSVPGPPRQRVAHIFRKGK